MKTHPASVDTSENGEQRSNAGFLLCLLFAIFFKDVCIYTVHNLKDKPEPNFPTGMSLMAQSNTKLSVYMWFRLSGEEGRSWEGNYGAKLQQPSGLDLGKWKEWVGELWLIRICHGDKERSLIMIQTCDQKNETDSSFFYSSDEFLVFFFFLGSCSVWLFN